MSVSRTNPEKITRKIDESSNKIEEIKKEVIPKPTKILTDGLPDNHSIQVVFVPQAPLKDWSEPWQDACEEASLLTLHYFYENTNPTPNQIHDDILSMINFESQQGWTSDINVSQMSLVAQNYLNLKPVIIDNPSIEQIKKYISQDIPVIIPADGKTLFKENSHFHSGGPYYHNLVITGYDEAAKKFIVNDVGTQFGKNFHYSYKTLMESIHDFPDSNNKEDIKMGPKKALVLLQ